MNVHTFFANSVQLDGFLIPDLIFDINDESNPIYFDKSDTFIFKIFIIVLKFSLNVSKSVSFCFKQSFNVFLTVISFKGMFFSVS